MKIFTTLFLAILSFVIANDTFKDSRDGNFYSRINIAQKAWLNDLIGINIWSSGEKDSINVEPTYMLANTYEPIVLMNCKCVENDANN